MGSSAKFDSRREVNYTEWRLLQAAYIVGIGLLMTPVYYLVEADLELVAVLWTALVVVTITLLRHRVLARVKPPGSDE